MRGSLLRNLCLTIGDPRAPHYANGTRAHDETPFGLRPRCAHFNFASRLKHCNYQIESLSTNSICLPDAVVPYNFTFIFLLTCPVFWHTEFIGFFGSPISNCWGNSKYAKSCGGNFKCVLHLLRHPTLSSPLSKIPILCLAVNYSLQDHRQP